MTDSIVARRRLRAQQLIEPRFSTPAEVVGWMGAVQAQDYPAARWALAQRCDPPLSAEAVDRALDEGSILRTHVLRPTWHFVTPRDAAWMLALSGPRVLRGLKARQRDLLLDAGVFAQAREIFQGMLAGGHSAARAELEAALNREGIDTRLPQRFVHILLESELSGLLVSGPLRGKQPTYTLLAERAAGAEGMPADQAAGELARRYFSSHGPAALKDFCWWSGLNLGAARAAVEGAGLRGEIIDGVELFSAGDAAAASPDGSLHLLPNYDEYVVAYADRSHIFDPAHAGLIHLRGGVLNNVVTRGGLVVGGWTRVIKKQAVKISAAVFEPLSSAERDALEDAARAYAAHLALDAEIELVQTV